MSTKKKTNYNKTTIRFRIDNAGRSIANRIKKFTTLKTLQGMSDQALRDGDTSWLLTSTALVMLMIPGLGYFYSGLGSHKNALSLIFLSMISLAVVSFQWFLWGYSLSFADSSNGNAFIGNFQHSFFMGLGPSQLVPYISTAPGLAFVVYQGMFAAITPALALGAAAERTRIIPLVVFLFLWSTFVYDFIAYWTWSVRGWLRVLGSLDFAGGTPVHISSGAAGIAYSVVAGRRFDKGHFKPHSLSSVFLGTALLWFGWFGFNGGSSLAADGFAALALVNTNLSACSGGLAWVLLDYGGRRKFSAFSVCCGALAGLFCITPGAGYVAPWSAFLFGIVGTLACHTFLRFKHTYGFDDALDVFGVHGIGGITGNILTGIFANSAMNPAVKGWVDGHFMQVVYQIVGTVAGFAWSFVITFIIMFVMNKLPYLNLRLTEENEVIGLDKSQLGETAYDYLEALVGAIPIAEPGVAVKAMEETGHDDEVELKIIKT